MSLISYVSLLLLASTSLVCLEISEAMANAGESGALSDGRLPGLLAGADTVT